MALQQHDNNGFVTLMATLVVSMFGMFLAYALLHESGWSAGTAEAVERSFHARNHAYACAEIGLLQIVSGESIEIEGDWNFNTGSCEFAILPGESEYLVQSIGYTGTAVQHVRADIETETIVTESATTTHILRIRWSENE